MRVEIDSEALKKNFKKHLPDWKKVVVLQPLLKGSIAAEAEETRWKRGDKKEENKVHWYIVDSTIFRNKNQQKI